MEGGLHEGGRTPSIADKPHGKNVTDFETASDFYHHYKEDIALFAGMGLKMFRFSISWTRILKDGDGMINPEGLTFYDNVINECLKYGIEPLVTIHHMDYPEALMKKGGWHNPASIDWFVQYAKVLFEHYGDRVKYWLTINEQNVAIYLAERFHTLYIPENCPNHTKEIYQQNHRMLVAQAKVIDLCHAMCPGAKIGPAPNISYVYPSSSRPADMIAAQNYNAMRNWLYLDVPVTGRYNEIVWSWLEEHDACPVFEERDAEILKKGKADFIAFNYYNTLTCSADDGTRELSQATDQQTARGEKGMFAGCANPYLEKTEFGWEIDPVGFRVTMREVYSRYHLPILITENGIGGQETLTKDGKVHDRYRIIFLKKHIEALQDSIDDGVQVIGYCTWSVMDLISTHQGFRKRYGFIYVNRTDEDLKDLKRIPKDSYYWYRKVIATNGKDIREGTA
jgi:6-phospho-beta-glucosidase